MGNACMLQVKEVSRLNELYYPTPSVSRSGVTERNPSNRASLVVP